MYECIEKSERDRANVLSAAVAEQQTSAERERTARENVTVALANAVHLLSAKCRRIELPQMSL
jgi:hypothetical protein